MDDLTPEIRARCLRCSYKMCGREAILPKSLPIPICYDPMETPQGSGGFADVWKGKHNGQEVAAKVLRVNTRGDIEKNRRVSCPRFVAWINKLIGSYAAILQGGLDMEYASSSERVAADRRDDDRKPASVRDGVTMDEEWERHRVSEA